MNTPLFDAAIAAIDACNAKDPRQALDEQGNPLPYELLYSQRMSETLAHFVADAPESLQLAARAQHIERWILPRENYPMDRDGYLAWRNALKQHHASRVRELLAKAGYDEQMQQKVASLILKEKFKSDQQAQQLEDVVCLVFLSHYLADFASKHDEAKLCDIIRKTWRKMSAEGQAAALQLPFTPEQQTLLGKALNIQ